MALRASPNITRRRASDCAIELLLLQSRLDVFDTSFDQIVGQLAFDRPGQDAFSRPRSRFLPGLAPESSATAPPARRSAKRQKVVLEGEAGELFERLRAWRSQTAQAASVPAYVVFTDATLQAIAETRP